MSTANGIKIAKFYNPKESQHPETRVFAAGDGHFNRNLSCQCKGPTCDHVLKVDAFLTTGVQMVGKRFKVYPAVFKFLAPSADKANVKLILAHIAARKEGVEPAVAPVVLKATPVTPASAPAPTVPAPAASLKSTPALWIDMDESEMKAAEASYVAAKAAKAADEAAIKAMHAAKQAAPKPPAKPEDPQVAAVKAGLWPIEID